MQHNLKPEVVPKIVDLLGKLPQTKNRLSDRLEDGQQCFCFEGVVCEAYRLEHPDTSRWVNDPETGELLFQVDPDAKFRKRGYAKVLPLTVSEWAHTRRSDLYGTVFFTDSDGGEDCEKPAGGLNDRGTTFPTFIKLLTED